MLKGKNCTTTLK